MKLLVINYEYPPIGGGAASACENYCKELAKSHQIVILTSSYRNLPRIEITKNLKIVRLNCLRSKASQSNVIEMTSFILSAFTQLGKIIDQEKPHSILIFFASPFGLLGLFAKFFFRTKFSVFIRGGDIPGFVASTNFYHWFLAPLTREILKQSEYILSNGAYLQALTEDFLKKSLSKKLRKKHVISISNGVQIEQNKATEIKRIDDLLFVGRLVQEQKNIFILPEILAKTSELKLTIVGDGPDKNALMQQFENLDLINRVNFVGWINKESLFQIYRSHKIILIPSFYEGVSNVLLEAIANEIYILSSNLPDSREQLENYGKSKIINHNSVQDYIESINELKHKPELLNSSIEEKVLEHHQWKRKAQILESKLLSIN